MRRPAPVLLVTCLLAGVVATLGTAGPAVAADRQPRAVASWSMVPQAKDANRDGVIDGDGGVPRRGALSSQPSAERVGAGNRVAQPNERLIDGVLSWYLAARGFPVRLDACGSSGDRARWTIAAPDGSRRTLPWASLGKRTCARTVTLPEGGYTVTLEVSTGGRTDRASLPVVSRNLLVVALGDSYASGEGNPRNVRSWLRVGGSFTPYWDDDACRRSVRGAPAQAALALERSDPHTSVTLLFLACSGATVDSGILGPQRGAGQSASQVEQASRILGGRAADLVTVSIGGNDVGFGSILQTCALSSDCPLARPAGGVLAGYPTVNAGVQAQTALLGAALDRVARCLGGTACVLADGRAVPGIALASTARVLPTLYPDITRGADGGPCTYLSIPAADFAWARATLLTPTPTPTYAYSLAGGGTAVVSVANGSLNQQVAASSRLPGWTPVVGTWSASADTGIGHGVCAGDAAWAYGFTGFTALPSASFHPNPAGQAAMAQAIAAAMQRP
jgi:lysophospholipase L1-like esterase